MKRVPCVKAVGAEAVVGDAAEEAAGAAATEAVDAVDAATTTATGEPSARHRG